MRSFGGAFLLVCLAAPALAAFAQNPGSPLAAISAQREQCRQADPYPRPVDVQQCDGEAVARTVAVTPDSEGTAALQPWLADLFDPLVYAITGGEDALAARVAAMSGIADFALRRGAILTGGDQDTVAGDTAAVNPLGPLRPYADADALHRRWTAIRAADCAAYPVSDCSARLDEALEILIGSLLANE